MLSRRDFLRNAALVAAGTVAANQIDLLDKIGWKRRFFPGWSARPLAGQPIVRILDQHGALLAEHRAVEWVNGVARFEDVVVRIPAGGAIRAYFHVEGRTAVAQPRARMLQSWTA